MSKRGGCALDFSSTNHGQFKRHRRGKRGIQMADERKRNTHRQSNPTSNDNEPCSLKMSEGYSQRRYKKWRNHTNDNLSASRASTSYERSESTTEEIPGFYYDADTKKYFKILSSNNSVNVLTKEKIESENAERKRLKDFSNLLCPAKLRESKKKISSSINLSHLLIQTEQGHKNAAQMENHVLMSNIETLQPSGSWTLVNSPEGVSEHLDHMLMMDSNQDMDKLLGLWSVKDSMKQRLQLLYLEEKRRVDHHTVPLSLHVTATDTAVVQTSSKISNVCWAPFLKSPEKNNVLYTTMCHTSYNYSLAFIRNMDRMRCEDESCNFDYNLGCHVAWTCAWNYHKQRFSVGSEKKGMLIDVETRRLWEFRCATDPFTQVFSPDSGEYLYSGGRNGSVFCHDLRSLSSNPVQLDYHKTSVCAVQMTTCGTYVLSADISGKVVMWDTRTCRVVMEYPSLFNRYSRIPLHLDETEQILYGAGQDCYTRFWCLKTGTLLKSVPPPCLATKGSVPAVQYSTRWGDRSGNAGLILGLGENLYFYSGLV